MSVQERWLLGIFIICMIVVSILVFRVHRKAKDLEGLWGIQIVKSKAKSANDYDLAQQENRDS